MHRYVYAYSATPALSAHAFPVAVRARAYLYCTIHNTVRASTLWVFPLTFLQLYRSYTVDMYVRTSDIAGHFA